jgi:hypothetical protein
LLRESKHSNAFLTLDRRACVSVFRSAALVVALMLLPALAWAQGTPSPKDAYLYIISPSDGDTVEGAFWCASARATWVSATPASRAHRALIVDPGQRQDALQDCPEANQHHQQSEQLREPAIIGKAVDRPKADRSNHDDDEDADQSGNHLCFPCVFVCRRPGWTKHRELSASSKARASENPSR